MEAPTWARDPKTWPFTAGGALEAMGAIVHHFKDAVTPRMRAAAKAAALLHLNGPPEHFRTAHSKGRIGSGTISGAMALAGALKDPDLFRIIKAIAEDDAALEERGFRSGSVTFEILRNEARSWLKTPFEDRVLYRR